LTRPFHLVDVFGTGPFTGNPLAVVSAADGLSSAEMQAITRWLNLSETAFLLPPSDSTADYRVRIFTLAHELTFAGHPTLGSAHVWLESGGRPRWEDAIVQECGAGLVRIRRDGSHLAFAAPRLLRGGTPSEEEIEEIASVLQISRSDILEAVWADNGPGWIAVMLDSAEAVLAVKPARHYHRRIDIGVVGPHVPGGEVAFELRAFFSDAHGALIEDPVTGSLNASVGQWLFASGRASMEYLAAQGTKLGRTGRIGVSKDAAGQVWVGGRTQTLFSGQSSGPVAQAAR
jgi:PhzF family phenazine biosynthesis protein